MTPQEIFDQLEGIAAAEDFVFRTGELTAAWESAGAGFETVEPVLRFMEAHPTKDYGAPGALVHFVERFHRDGYEEKLVESVERKPTLQTVWMLNRVINGTKQPDNGTKQPDARRRFVATMECVLLSPLADDLTRDSAKHYVDRLSRMRK
jgi:hypothetical protein